MARSVVRVVLLGLVALALFQLPVLAQGCPPYGPCPSPSPSPTPTETETEPDGEVDPGVNDGGAAEIQVVTDCSTIIIEDDSFGPGSDVIVDADFSGSDCPGSGDPPTVSGEIGGGGDGDDGEFATVGNGVTVADGQTIIEVGEDGRFSAILTVPANLPAGRLAVTLSGVDAAGEPHQESRAFEVRELAGTSAAGEPAQSGAMANIAIIALGAIIVVLLANQFRLRRASRAR